MNDIPSTLSASSATQSNAADRPSHEEISHRAQEIWENQGRPADRDEEIWLQAERELVAARSDRHGAIATAKTAIAATPEVPSSSPPSPGKERAGGRSRSGQRSAAR